MITIFGVSLSATTPWILIAIPAAASILIYTFRARGSGVSTVTSSLFLLSKLTPHLPARKTFLPPLQFWLELLALILLAVAAAGLTAARVGQRIAIVIDDSTSMSALTASQSTKLDEAKRLAQADIAQSSPTTRFSVFSADSDLRPITQGVVSSWQASESLKTIAQAHAADSLTSPLTTILADDSFDSVWVYTDKRRSDSSESQRLRVTTIPHDQSQTQNVWIHSASVVTTEQNVSLRVEIFSSSDRPSKPTVRASCSVGDAATPVELSAASAPVTSNKPATLILGPLQQAWSFCTISLLSDQQGPAEAIRLDDTAYVAKDSSFSSILVASSLSPLALGLTRLTDYSFTAETTNASSPTIYHRLIPALRPSTPSLVIFPPVGALPWKGGSVLAAPAGPIEVTRWTEAHPVTRYTQPQLLSIPSARVLTCPDSATPLMHSPYGPLACVGEESGARYLIVGFELLPFDGIKSPTLSVLTLNALTWLFRDQTQHTESSQLSSKLLHEKTSVERLAPGGIALLSPSERLGALRQPGILKLSTPQDVAAHTELLAINSLSDEESDLRGERVLTIPPRTTRPTTTSGEDFEYASALAALALLILFIDLIRRLRRTTQWGTA